MACKKPWCPQCNKNEKPGSKIKERLKKKIEKRNTLEKCKQNDLVRENTTDVNRLVVDFKNVEDAKLFLKHFSNKKQQLKEEATPTEPETIDHEDKKKPVAQKKRNKKNPKKENTKQNNSVEIQKIVDFIEGKDRDAETAKKQKNIEKKARRREKKIIEKQIEEQPEPETVMKSEQPKESEQFVQKSDVKNVTVNYDSNEESVNLTLSLSGKSSLIEKIIATVIQAVPDVKESIINESGYIDKKNQDISHLEIGKENNNFEKTNVKQKKRNKKNQLPPKIDETSSIKLETINNLKNHEMNNTPNSENATFLKGPDGMITIKRPGINIRKIDRFNYKIEEAKNPKAKNGSLTSTPLNNNKENDTLSIPVTKADDEHLYHILHELPEITITRREKK